MEDTGHGFPGSFGVGGRQARKRRLASQDVMALIDKIGNPASVFLQDFHGGVAEIAGAVQSVFLTDMLQGKEFVLIKGTGGHRAGGKLQEVGKIFPVMDSFPKV